MNDSRFSITDVAVRIGVTPKTIVRWEKAKKVNRAKRDWRGWRVYDKDDLKRLRAFKDTIIIYEEDGNGKDI